MNHYVGLASMKAALDLSTSTSEDARLFDVVAGVSRAFDRECHRALFAASQTRYYTARYGDHLDVDDLLAVTSLKTDSAGDRTYATTWSTSDYDLYPDNARLASPPEPYWRLIVAPLGRYGFDGARRGVQIAGTFGHFDERTASTASLNSAQNSTSATLPVSASSAFEVGQTLLVESEQQFVTAIPNSTALTVTRAVNGTTASAHSSGTIPDVYTYPVVSEACKIQVARIFKRPATPYGFQQSPDFGAARVVRVDPDVLLMLGTFRRGTVV